MVLPRGARPSRLRAVLVALPMLLLLAAPSAVASAGVAGEPQAPPHFGYNEDWVSERGRLDMARSSGADTARLSIPWSQIEPVEGSLNWAPWDRLYTAVVRAGMRPLLILTDAPCWAYSSQPGRCGAHHDNARPPLTRHLDSWSTFAGYVARRYPLALGIEVWNEPNFKQFWRSGLPNPIRYGRLLAAAFRGIKDANRRMPVVAAGLVTSMGAGEGLPYLGFLKQALEVAGPSHYDAVAIHPYPFFSDNPIRSVYEDLVAVRELLASIGETGTPIWVTEVGVSTEGPDAYSPGGQAFVLGSIYDVLEYAPDVPVIVVHRFVDDRWVEGSWEAGFGVVTEAGLPKPVYCVFAHKRGVRDGLC